MKSDILKNLFFSLIILACGLILYGSLQVDYAQSNELKFEHITTMEGLSYFGISIIFQDSQGFMWFGSGIGLDRFDGYNFTHYNHLPIRSNSTMIEDKKGFIWIIVDGGILYRYDRVVEKFKSYPFSKKVRRIFEDKDGDIWISTSGDGLGRYIHSRDSIVVYKHMVNNPNSIRDNNVNTVFEDRKRILWIGTDQGLNSFNKKTDSFSYRKLDLSPYIHSIVEDRNNNLWVGSSEGLYELNNKDETFKHIRNINWQYNFIYTLFEDSRDKLWIGSEGGISAFDKAIDKFFNYENYMKGVTPYTTMAYDPIFEDKSGVIWVLNSGHLAKFNTEMQKFDLIREDESNPNSLSDGTVLSICEDKMGSLWFGTASGVDKLDKNRKPFTKIMFKSGSGIRFGDDGMGSLYEDSEGLIWFQTLRGLYQLIGNTNKTASLYYSVKNFPLPDRLIALDIKESPEGSLWLTTWGDGLIRFDKATGNFTYFTNDPSNSESISDNSVNSIVIDSTGNMWVSAMTGVLDRFDRTKNIFTHFVYDSIPYPGVLPHNIGVLCLDKFSNIWICTRGLAVFNIEKQSFKFFYSDSTKSGSLSSDEVFSICEDSKGILWFGTSKGLNKYDRQSDTFSCIDAKNGLASDFIKGILEDNGERGKGKSLWLLTLKGISKYNPSTGTIRNYGPGDGVTLTASLSGHSYFKSKTGELYFGGENGIIRFNPEDIKDNPYIPPVVITSFKKFNEETKLDSSITEKKLIELPYNENNISFEFAALNYSSTQKNQYAYKMEGVDKNWVYSGTRHFASYPNLNPGKYIFRVKGSNNDGVWNEEGTFISIIIAPPWWKTFTAYTSYALIFIFSLYGIRRYEMNRLRLKDKIKMDEAVLREKEETDKMKSRFFANISHEFRTPLTLILGPAEKISSKISDDIVKDANIIKRNSRHLLLLINQLLDLSKLEAGKLKLEASKGNIVSFVKGVALSFESLAESKDISLKIISEKEYIEIYFDKEKMMKILTNILSNAFKFTPVEGKISVLIAETEKKSVEIKIRDTGIGVLQEEIPRLFDRFYQVDSSITREYEGTGIGLALTKELVELHKGKIRAESEKGVWTEFILEFPPGRDHLTEEEILQEKEIKEDIILNRIVDISKSRERIESLDSASQAHQNAIDTNEEKTIILVVEDNYDMRQYIKESLDANYQVEEAVNGEQGVRKAEKIIPDLIISDMMMPKMDGNELVRILKNDERTSHVPIILLTAKAGQENKLEGLEMGADDYITKPFDIRELQVRIKNLINIRKKLQESFSKINFRQSSAKETKLRSIDEKFMSKVGKIIEKHISEEGFSIEEFGSEIGMSRMQLHRKLKALTGKSASRYIRFVKLEKGRKMIEAKEGNISEIAYSLGFGSPTYFSRCFREEFGYPPSEIQS